MKWRKNLDWQIEFDKRAKKELQKLDRHVQKIILAYCREKISKDPKTLGKALTGDLAGLWRFRVGNYRLVCKLEDEKICVLVLRLGHRKSIYSKFSF
jgi:mRNA interferase RelE/StbE